MTRALSFLLIIWWSLFVFNKDAACSENTIGATNIDHVGSDENLTIYTINSILGLSAFDPPEEFVFEMMPGHTFFMPVEVIDEESIIANTSL